MPLLSYYYPTIIKLSTNDYALVILLLSDYHQIFIPLFSHFTTILITLNYHFCPLNPLNFQTNLCRGAGWQPSWLLQYNLDTALSETISWVPQLQLHRMSWDDECVYNTCQSMMSLSQEHAESCYLPSLSIIFLYFLLILKKIGGPISSINGWIAGCGKCQTGIPGLRSWAEKPWTVSYVETHLPNDELI